MARAAAQQEKVPFGTTPRERATMARAMSALYVAGGLLVVATVLLPHSANTDDLGVAGPGALAILMGVLLYRFGDQLRVTELQLLLGFSAFLVTVCVIYGGDSSSAYPYLYLWVSLYAYYFFSTRAAAELVVLCIGLYALAFRLEDDTPVAAVHWLMATGTVVVGGLMIGRLTTAIRAQAEDLAAVSRMAGGLSSLDDFAQATCESLRGSAGADVVIFLEPVELGTGLHVTAIAGTAAAGTAFTGAAARAALERAFQDGEPVELVADAAAGRRRPFAGQITGLAQPVLREGATAAVLAVAWTRPRRVLSERLRTAAMLFAAEASLALDRAERASLAREQQALEINDNIVQGLVVAKYSAQRGDMAEAIRALDETLGRARRLITDQLQSVAHGRSGAIRPGDLARSEASTLDDDVPAQAATAADATGLAAARTPPAAPGA